MNPQNVGRLLKRQREKLRSQAADSVADCIVEQILAEEREKNLRKALTQRLEILRPKVLCNPLGGYTEGRCDSRREEIRFLEELLAQ